MRRYILFVLFLCLHWVAWGQKDYEYRYWFDKDHGKQQTGTFSSGMLHIDADLSGLDASLHAFHLQVKDTGGVWSAPVTRYFVHDVAPKTTFEYWMDSEMQRHQLSAPSGHVDMDVSGLEEGLHFLRFQLSDNQGQSWSPLTRCFFKIPREEDFTCSYWVDADYANAKSVKYTGEPVMLDVADMEDGFHILYMQVHSKNSASMPATRMFIKVPQTAGVSSLTCICLIDGQLYKSEQVASEGGVVKWDLDVASLSQGLHNMQVQVLTPTGAATNVSNHFFIRTALQEELDNMSLVYSVDGKVFQSVAGKASNGLYHFDVDVASLDDGLHRITYQLASETGTSTRIQTDFFIKTPVGGYGIMSYRYWLNNNMANAKTVQLDKRTSPFVLTKLLPVDTEPIRSACFQFEVKDGRPMVYAKNDFHISFFDATGRQVDECKQYVDYGVSQAVEDITDLQATQTFARPATNTVKWFKFEAEKGDTIAVRTNQASSIQVFSPSGKEIYAASADKSVIYGGCHTWEDGTFYIAVHDVTGTKPSITLDYMHMDKYDVVAQDVHVVGNGGCSTITFQGNGFRNLCAVDLFTVNGDTIHAVDIGHESDASTTATFDFSGVELGKYDALFHFSEEDKTFKNNITVEEAKDIELVTKVSYPSTFLRGGSATYSVEITNKGNMTAYFVPTEISLLTEDFTNITSVIFKDKTGKRVDGLEIEGIDTDSIDSDLLCSYIDEINGISGLSSFSILSDSTNNCEIGFTDRYFSIPPMSTVAYQVEIMSTNAFSLYARVPNKWFAVKTLDKNYALRAKSVGEICCEKEKWECISSNISNILGFIPGATGCIASLADFGVYSTFEIMCADGASPLDKLKNALSNKTANFINKGLSSALNCAGARILKQIQDLKNKLKDLEQARKLKLQQAVNYNRIYENAITNYDEKMWLAEEYYKAGNIDEAERIAEEAKTIKNNALRFKEESDNCYKEADRLTSEMNNCTNQIDQENLNMANLLGHIKNGLNFLQDAISCSSERLDAAKKCRDGDSHGGSSSPVNSYDPNDIFGYIAPSGSKFIGKSVVTLPYRIEFENDTTFATASAHVVEVKDTLDSKLFDLATYAPTSIKIGDKTEYLDGSPNFVKTIDMRPAINALAQVEGRYDQANGIATWRFTSIDPMTMEPTDDVMQGFLPVNYDGKSGIGEVAFDISLKQQFEDGTQIPNRANIIFDTNDPIMTPTWTNTVDAIAPESQVTEVVQLNDSIARIYVEGADSRSGVWKYDVYVQQGSGAAWIKAAECTADSSFVDYRFYEGLDYGFCVLATDSAGNVEQKELAREGTFVKVNMGDVNSDGEINTLDTSLTNAYYLEQPVAILVLAADVNGDGVIDTLDSTQITQLYLNANNTAGAKATMARQRITTTRTIKQ